MKEEHTSIQISKIGGLKKEGWKVTCWSWTRNVQIQDTSIQRNDGTTQTIRTLCTGEESRNENPQVNIFVPDDSVCGVPGIHLCFKRATYSNIYRRFQKTIGRAVALALSFWVCQGHIMILSSSFPGVSKPACACSWACVCMCGSSLNKTAQKSSVFFVQFTWWNDEQVDSHSNITLIQQKTKVLSFPGFQFDDFCCLTILQ